MLSYARRFLVLFCLASLALSASQLKANQNTHAQGGFFKGCMDFVSMVWRFDGLGFGSSFLSREELAEFNSWHQFYILPELGYERRFSMESEVFLSLFDDQGVMLALSELPKSLREKIFGGVDVNEVEARLLEIDSNLFSNPILYVLVHKLLLNSEWQKISDGIDRISTGSSPDVRRNVRVRLDRSMAWSTIERLLAIRDKNLDLLRIENSKLCSNRFEHCISVGETRKKWMRLNPLAAEIYRPDDTIPSLIHEHSLDAKYVILPTGKVLRYVKSRYMDHPSVVRIEPQHRVILTVEADGNWYGLNYIEALDLLYMDWRNHVWSEFFYSVKVREETMELAKTRPQELAKSLFDLVRGIESDD